MIELDKHFINLTNGIEAIPSLNSDYAFIRIQSTACEQHRWDYIIRELDYNFLMSLALGYHCIVHDYGANKSTPRSVYQGLVWIEYVLNRHWFGREIYAYVRAHNCRDYFAQCYAELSDASLRKLDYFKRFVSTDHIRLDACTYSTTHDGDYGYYVQLLKEGPLSSAY